MAKVKPNIDVPHNGIAGAHSLVNSVINDFFIYSHSVDSISLNDELFSLTLNNKKFVYQEVKVDSNKDYINIYLQGVLKDKSTYSAVESGNNIVIEFNESITLRPEDIVANDFEVRGKIVSR